MRRLGSGTGLLSRLAGLVARRSRDTAAKAPPPAPPKETALTDDAFRLSLLQMLAEDDGQYQARLQIISLVEFREAVGDKWYQVADKVMLIAEGVIQLHIGAGNVFGRQGEDFFALMFRTCPPLEARRRALDIARELGTRLVGDKVLGTDRPLALAAEVPLAGAVNPDGTLKLSAMAQAVDEMRAMVATAPQGLGDDGLRSWMKQRLEPDAGPLPLRYHLRPGAPPPPKEPEPLRASLRPSAPLPPQPPPPPRAAKAPSAPSGLMPEENGGQDPGWAPLNPNAPSGVDRLIDGDRPLPPDARLSLLWRPTWVGADETIGAYRAHVQRVDADGQPPQEGSLAYCGGEATARSLDHFLIGAAMRGFRGAELAGLGSTALLPLHWATLQSPQRMTLLAPLADATAASRSARLVIELFGLPAGLGEDALAAAIATLRPMCREVLLRTTLAAPSAGLAARCGASMVGLDLSDLPQAQRTDDDRLLAALLRFRTEADKAGLGAFLWGIRRRKVVAGTILGGFALVNGPALMKDLAKPAKVLPAPRARFAATTV